MSPSPRLVPNAEPQTLNITSQYTKRNSKDEKQQQKQYKLHSH